MLPLGWLTVTTQRLHLNCKWCSNTIKKNCGYKKFWNLNMHKQTICWYIYYFMQVTNLLNSVSLSRWSINHFIKIDWEKQWYWQLHFSFVPQKWLLAFTCQDISVLYKPTHNILCLRLAVCRSDRAAYSVFTVTRAAPSHQLWLCCDEHHNYLSEGGVEEI